MMVVKSMFSLKEQSIKPLDNTSNTILSFARGSLRRKYKYDCSSKLLYVKSNDWRLKKNTKMGLWVFDWFYSFNVFFTSFESIIRHNVLAEISLQITVARGLKLDLPKFCKVSFKQWKHRTAFKIFIKCLKTRELSIEIAFTDNLHNPSYCLTCYFS